MRFLDDFDGACVAARSVSAFQAEVVDDIQYARQFIRIDRSARQRTRCAQSRRTVPRTARAQKACGKIVIVRGKRSCVIGKEHETVTATSTAVFQLACTGSNRSIQYIPVCLCGIGVEIRQIKAYRVVKRRTGRIVSIGKHRQTVVFVSDMSPIGPTHVQDRRKQAALHLRGRNNAVIIRFIAILDRLSRILQVAIGIESRCTRYSIAEVAGNDTVNWIPRSRLRSRLPINPIIIQIIIVISSNSSDTLGCQSSILTIIIVVRYIKVDIANTKGCAVLKINRRNQISSIVSIRNTSHHIVILYFELCFAGVRGSYMDRTHKTTGRQTSGAPFNRSCKMRIFNRICS